jgi:adenylate cyclase
LENEHSYFVLKGQQTEDKLYLNLGGSWTIGRSAENAFAFEDSSMSRRHAVVQELQPGKFYLIDLGSRNGSTLNGRRVTTSVELHDGDSVGCGETTLVFHKPGGESQTGRSLSGDATLGLLRRRLTTVLVVDIRDFTTLSCQIDEELLAQTVGTWFRELGSIFRRSGCVTEKYIGDAAMAVWVHEGRIPDQKQMRRVLEALIEIQKFTANLQKQFSLPSPVRIGAGINIGLSAIGNSGPQENPDFSPLGESVNAAFRLESSTKNSGFDVALGRLAFDCLGVTPNVARHFEKRIIELKGYDQPTEVYLTSYSALSRFL